MENVLLKYTLRMDEELVQKMKVIAEDERRSLNREFEYIIKLSVKHFENKHGKITREDLAKFGFTKK